MKKKKPTPPTKKDPAIKKEPPIIINIGEVDVEVEEIEEMVVEIEKQKHKKHPECTYFALVFTYQKNKFIPMALQLLVDKSAVDGVLTLLRGPNSFPVNDAAFSNVQLSGFDAAVIGAVTDGATNVTVTPLAVGSTTLTVDCDVAYNDASVGQTTVHKTTQIIVNVVAEPTLEQTVLTVVFGPQS